MYVQALQPFCAAIALAFFFAVIFTFIFLLLVLRAMVKPPNCESCGFNHPMGMVTGRSLVP